MKLIILAAILVAAYAEEKVIGGSEANEGQIKSIASLRKSNNQFCGATLISEMWLVSAAHCYQAADTITVHVGDFNLLIQESAEQFQVPKNCIRHENYKPRTMENDIMLIELTVPFKLENDVQAAGIPALGANLLTTGTKCRVCGWGNILTVGTLYPLKPHCVDIKVIDKNECNGLLAYNGDVKDGMVCIGDMSGGIDSCQGDSGGPVYCGASGLIGDDEGEFSAVVSWGVGCALPNKPGVYSEIAYYRQWINNLTGI